MSIFKKYGYLAGLFCASLLLTATAFAAPLTGIPQTVTQPDGTEAEVYLYGDEVYSYMCDADRNVIVQRPDNQFYVYAALDGDQVVPTNYVFQPGQSGGSGGGSAGTGRLKAEDIPDIVIENAYENSSLKKQQEQASTYQLTARQNHFLGQEINNLVIFIQFKNTPFTQSQKSFYEGLFNTDADSVKNFYAESSYGKLGVNSVFYPASPSAAIRYYTDPNPASYYNGASYGYNTDIQAQREQEMFSRAIDAVRDSIPETLDLDKNNDGDIDMITFVLSGDLCAGTNEVRWPHKWGFWSEAPEINGKRPWLYNVQVEQALRGRGTTLQKGAAIICHETQHILGFPDLYYHFTDADGASDISAMGKWDIMCASDGAHSCAYIKNYYGQWLDIPEIKESGTYTLNPLTSPDNNAYMIRSPKNSSEFFVIEYRVKTGAFESNVASSSLVVYRILTDKMGFGNYSAQRPGGKYDEVRAVANTSGARINLYFSNGNSTGISISNTTTNSKTATFTVNFPNDKIMGYFRDPNLASQIFSAIGKPQNEVTMSDLQSLTTLNLSLPSNKMPLDLTGLDQLTGLKTLNAAYCKIDEISPIANMENLETVDIRGNDIKDITPLAGLAKLKNVMLRGNLIDDYSVLKAVYGKLTVKDFSLDNSDDAVVWLPHLSNDGTLNMAAMKFSAYAPSSVFCVAEKYANDGTLMKRRWSHVYKGTSETVQFSIPAEIRYDDDSYVLLHVYERDDYRTPMSEIQVRKNNFNLSLFQ